VSISSFDDPAHWRAQAKETRNMAEQTYDLQAKAAMLRIAEDYERLAKRTEARAIGHPPNSK
jgi:hypothetical protein